MTDNSSDIGDEETIVKIEVAPLHVEECVSASSESDQNKKQENSRCVPCWKAKMCYLTDLMVEEDNASLGVFL